MARTPEELERMLEDAFVLHDREALGQLFEPDAVVHPAGWHGQVYGREQIERLAVALWDDKHTYVAHPLAVLQSRDTALVVGECAVNVVRRAPDGNWRYLVMYLYQPRSRHSDRCGRSAPSVVSAPWPG